MKSNIFLIAILFLVTKGFSQNCVTLFEGSNFGITNSDAQINSLAIDASGNKWMGIGGTVLSYGLGKFDGITWTNYQYSTINNNTIPSNRVNGIAFDGSSNVWVATQNGVGKLTGTNWTRYNTTSGLASNTIKSITVDGSNNIWAGTNSGVSKFNGSTWSTYTTTQGLPDNSINVITSKGSEIWVGTNSGAAKFNGSSWISYNTTSGLPHNTVNCIFIDAAGNKWIGTYSGLCKYNNTDITIFTTINSGLPQNNIKNITQDNNGVIWIETSSGLTLFNGTHWKTFHKDNCGLPDNNIDPIAYESGANKIWFGYQKIIGINSNASLGAFYPSSSLGLNILASNGFLICDGDSTTLSTNGNFTTFHWNYGVLDDTSPSITLYQNESVFLAAGNSNNCFDYDTAVVHLKTPFDNQQICVVLVSNISGYNLIAWDKVPNVGTAYFKIYKREQLGINYNYIGSRLFSESSIYIDSSSNPHLLSERYKISVVDSCGNESGLSQAHKTIHLGVANGTQLNSFDLSVDNYEGILFSNYEIWRGPDTSNMQLLTAPSIGNLVFNDNTVGAAQTVYYQIRMNLTSSCISNTTKDMTGPFSQSLSNIEDNIITPANNESILNYNKELNIYPNPFSDITTISFENSDKSDYTLIIKNEIGQHVLEIKNITNNYFVLNKGSLNSGIYFLELTGNKTFKSRIIVE